MNTFSKYLPYGAIVVLLGVGVLYYGAFGVAQSQYRFALLGHASDVINAQSTMTQDQKDETITALFKGIPAFPVVRLAYGFSASNTNAGNGHTRSGGTVGQSDNTCPPTMANACKELSKAVNKAKTKCANGAVRNGLKKKGGQACSQDDQELSDMNGAFENIADMAKECAQQGCTTPY